MSVSIRDATRNDAAACAAIYAPYVLDTVVSFEDDPPTGEEMARRIAAAQERHAWLVAVDDDRVVGYAYAGPFGGRAAYRWAAETSIYLETGCRRTGAGRRLYAALLDRLAELGACTAAAGMTLPNPASEGLHAALGFTPIGTFRAVGWKHDAWHDVAWVQVPLGREQSSVS